MPARILWGLLVKADAEGDLVCRKEADAVKILGQTVGVLIDVFNGIVPVFLVNPHGEKGADAVGLQEHHHIADGPVFNPGLADHRQFLLGNPGDLSEVFDFIFKHVKGIITEVFDDFLGRLWPHPLDEPGSEVFLQRCGCGGFLFNRLEALNWRPNLGCTVQAPWNSMVAPAKTFV